MLFYYLMCRKNTERKNSKIVETKNGRIMLSSNCADGGSKISESVKEQEAKVLLRMIGKIPLISLLLRYTIDTLEKIKIVIYNIK